MITFDVPLPPRGVSSNARGHWRSKAQAVANYRSAVWVAAYSAGLALMASPRARVSLLFGIKGGRALGLYQPRDVPNAVDAFKAGFDGLKDAGLIVDDSRRHMELGTVEITAKDGPWVRVTIEEVTQ